jgi:hypothetical protein
MSRQRIQEFRARLDRLAQRAPSGPGKRILIDTTGSRSRSGASRDLEHRLALYARRRLETVSQEMVLLSRMRDLGAVSPQTQVSCAGAFWQAFRGTTENPACHTSPGLLRLNGLMPTVLTNNLVIRRHLVLVFGDCMLMPVAVNKLDSWIDENMGWDALTEAAAQVTNGARPAEAVQIYIDLMRATYGSMVGLPPRELAVVDSFESSLDRPALTVEDDYRMAYDALVSHDEALMHGPPLIEIRNYQSQVDAQIQEAADST